MSPHFKRAFTEPDEQQESGRFASPPPLDNYRHKDNLTSMSLIGQIMGKSHANPTGRDDKREQAVMVLLEGTGSPEKVYKQNDLTELAGELKNLVQRTGVGQFGGNEFGPVETTLFMFGPDADRLFSTIEPALRASGLCKGARVVIRYGGPGANQRQVKI